MRSRRSILLWASGIAASLVSLRPAFGQSTLTPTPACEDSDEPTPRQTAGPFYKPKSPQRASLVEPGETAPSLRLSGRILTTRCKPVPGALVDIWHADGRGDYDLQGFRYRGHVFANKDGRYDITTIIPGVYEGRTRHYHARVQPPAGAILTTQLYFPDEKENARDFLFNRALLMTVEPSGGLISARYDFVVRS